MAEKQGPLLRRCRRRPPPNPCGRRAARRSPPQPAPPVADHGPGRARVSELRKGCRDADLWIAGAACGPAGPPGASLGLACRLQVRQGPFGSQITTPPPHAVPLKSLGSASLAPFPPFLRALPRRRATPCAHASAARSRASRERPGGPAAPAPATMGAVWEAQAWDWGEAKAWAAQWLAVWLVGLVLGWLVSLGRRPGAPGPGEGPAAACEGGAGRPGSLASRRPPASPPPAPAPDEAPPSAPSRARLTAASSNPLPRSCPRPNGWTAASRPRRCS